MPNRKHHFVATFPKRILRIMTQMIEIQNSENIHQVQGTTCMSRTRFRQGSQNQFANMLRFAFQTFITNHISRIKSLTTKKIQAQA